MTIKTTRGRIYMGSFTSPPIVRMHGLYRWELFTAYTYYRNPIYDKDGNVKRPEDYTEEEKRHRSFEKIVVPAGYITDLATIPRPLWSIFPPHDVYAKAAILHDFLYDNAIGSKAEADLVFHEAMLVLGIPKWKAFIFYWGVRLFGRGKYKK